MTITKSNYHSTEADKTYVLFAVDQPCEELTPEWLSRLDIPFKELTGCYQGETEASYLVAWDEWQLFQLSAPAFILCQETVLVLGPSSKDGSRPAILQHFNGLIAPEYLGVFAQTSKEEALRSKGWTFDPSTKTYFTCMKEFKQPA